ncbi:MAG: hypothetical protein M1832_001679 [Thelocarpon impressellum]|nr:MAG: hypothetical protein M1832_001679 [Thelocarpon impressellum]
MAPTPPALRSALLSWRRECRRRFASSPLSADKAKIVEVGPRDGLQNEKKLVPLHTKLELIQRLAKTGLTDIEAGAFVSPKWVPQMANSAEILQELVEDPPSSPHPISYSFLVPNLKGLETALSVAEQSSTSHEPNASPATGSEAPQRTTRNPSILREISVFAAATESFSRKNTNCSITESLDRFRPVFSLAKSHNIRRRAYISVVLGCPYEGPDVSPARVAELALTLLDMGADEISLGDTTGMGTSPRVRELLRTLASAGVPTEKLAVHFHDTYGQAVVNSSAALEHGIRIFDSSVSGLGGCPYAKGATGNVATEDVVYFLHSLGIDTGVDLERLATIGDWISDILERKNGSRAGEATVARR